MRRGNCLWAQPPVSPTPGSIILLVAMAGSIPKPLGRRLKACRGGGDPCPQGGSSAFRSCSEVPPAITGWLRPGDW